MNFLDNEIAVFGFQTFPFFWTGMEEEQVGWVAMTTAHRPCLLGPPGQLDESASLA